MIEKVDKIIEIRKQVIDFIDNDFGVEYGFLVNFDSLELLDIKIGKNGEVEFWDCSEISYFKNLKHILLNLHTHSVYFENGCVIPPEIYPSIDDFAIFISSRSIFKYQMILSMSEILFLEFFENRIQIICYDSITDYAQCSIIRIDYPNIFRLPYVCSYHLIIFQNIINIIDRFYKKLGYSIDDNGIILK